MWWWKASLYIRGISRRKARMHQLSFDKGHFVCPAVCGAHNVCGPIANVRTSESLCENSTLFTKNFARAKTPCGWKACPKARISFCFVGNYAKFPTATHGDGVCATAVVDRIVRMLGMFEHSVQNPSRQKKNGLISKWKPMWQSTLGRCWWRCFSCRLSRDWLRGIVWSMPPVRARCTKALSRV